jgi:hypothetical protein
VTIPDGGEVHVCGSNVNSCPFWSTAVHWVGVGQANPLASEPATVLVVAGAPGRSGLKVFSSPSAHTVHCVLDGQMTVCPVDNLGAACAGGSPGA